MVQTSKHRRSLSAWNLNYSRSVKGSSAANMKLKMNILDDIWKKKPI